MKQVMARQSSKDFQGVPSFQFLPSTSINQKLLFELNRPLDDLHELLLEDFRGRTAKMREIYEEHCVDTPYIKANYKKVLKQMEQKSLIRTQGRRTNRGFADDIVVTFPG